MRTSLGLCAFLLATSVSSFSFAEQKVTAGNYEIHYIVIPTTFLRPSIAHQYGLPRGKNKALVNVSVLTTQGRAVDADIRGKTHNLLEQSQSLTFTKVEEGQAIYYLALFVHADEEHHRIELDITLPGNTRKKISFMQKMYWEE